MIPVGSAVRIVNVLTGDVRDGTVTETKRAITVASGAWSLTFSPRTRRGQGECSRWAMVLPGEDAAAVAARWRAADGYGRTLEDMRAQVERSTGKRPRNETGPEGASAVPPIPETLARCAACLRHRPTLHALKDDVGSIGFFCADCGRGRMQ